MDHMGPAGGAVLNSPKGLSMDPMQVRPATGVLGLASPAGEESGPKPRPFIYRLRKNPTGRIVVVIREYDLDDRIGKPPYTGL